MTELKTILFDFDGVVIDSEPLHAKAKKLVLDRLNISYPPTLFDEFKGRTDNVFFDYVSGTLDPLKRPPDTLYASKKIIFEEIVNELKLVDGFPLFLSKVKEKGIGTALVSSTSLYSLALVEKLYNISGMFNLIITEVDTDLHKPYPDPYLKAMEKLDVSSDGLIVIEDSPNGIISAKRAGCFVYGLTSSFDSRHLLEAGADVIADNYDVLARILGL
jgi:beta-phosphoglucomutase